MLGVRGRRWLPTSRRTGVIPPRWGGGDRQPVPGRRRSASVTGGRGIHAWGRGHNGPTRQVRPNGTCNPAPCSERYTVRSFTRRWRFSDPGNATSVYIGGRPRSPLIRGRPVGQRVHSLRQPFPSKWTNVWPPFSASVEWRSKSGLMVCTIRWMVSRRSVRLGGIGMSTSVAWLGIRDRLHDWLLGFVDGVIGTSIDDAPCPFGKAAF